MEPCLFNPALVMQKQASLCEFEANLVYIVSSRTARVTEALPQTSKNKNKNKNTIKVGILVL